MGASEPEGEGFTGNLLPEFLPVYMYYLGHCDHFDRTMFFAGKF